MKHLLFPILLFVFLCSVSCSRTGDTLSHEGARRAAERYFNFLLDGEVEQYVDGLVGADSMSEDLRGEMIDLMAQFVAARNLNREMLSVVAADDSLRDSSAYVLLDILYHDSTTERVGMPLVFSDGRWWMQ